VGNTKIGAVIHGRVGDCYLGFNYISVSPGSLVLKERVWDASGGSLWESLMLLGLLSQHATYPVIVQTGASDIRLGSPQLRKEFDIEGIGCGKVLGACSLLKGKIP